MSIAPDNSDSELLAGNYCVSFIDLLGQRAALQGQGLLPSFDSEDERKKLNAILRESIGSIIKLQSQAEDMLQGILQQNPESSFRAALPPEQHALWDEMQLTRATTQRWSDGLMSFVSLGDRKMKCRMNGVFGLFCLAGTLCFLGLANHRPVRGAIEIAWGVELFPGELYGAAVARAYELESEIAQYPRIVIGSEMVNFLKAHLNNPEQDPFSQNDKALAEICLNMIIQDTDGYWLLHYLGEAFQYAVSHSHHAELYAAALNFVHEQLLEHQANLNTKLAFRYSHLLQYFDAHPPAMPKSAQPIIPPGAAQQA